MSPQFGRPLRDPQPVRFAWRHLLALVTLLTALALLGPAHATTYHPRTPEQMALAADMIFVGTVDTVDTVRGSTTDGRPWTEVTFRAEEWLAWEGAAIDRADPPEDLPATVTLEFLGGADGSEQLTVSGVPQFRVGQSVLLFAYDGRGLASPVVGVRQGAWTLDVRGARDELGEYLRVTSAGRLTRGPTGSGLDEVLDAVSALLDAGTLPTQPVDEELTGDEPANDGLPATDSGEEPAPEESAPSEEPATEEAEPGEPTESRTEEPEPEEPTTEEPADPETTDPETADPETGEPQTGEPQTADTETADPEAGEPTADATAPQAQPADTQIVVSFSVDESGGPLLLSTAVGSAARAWETAAPGLVTFVDADAAAEPEAPATGSAATHLIAYGDPNLFGPDALSFTLVRAGTAATEVLVSPSAGELLHPVLLHELGVLAGLPEGGAGVMASAVTAGATAPAPVDVEALRALQVFRPEDINRDGVVDFYDLAALAEAFGSRGVNLAADVNGDGVVDDRDLAAVQRAYQFLPPAESAPE